MLDYRGAAGMLTSGELCRRARITPRALQWWLERGIVSCHFVGQARAFDDGQALLAALLAELRGRGASLQALRKLAEIRKLAGEYLVTDGAEWCFWCAGAELIPFVTDYPGACLVICLEDLRQKIAHDKTPPRFARNPRN
jgi:DNA-binding transcriptional MerR regulator